MYCMYVYVSYVSLYPSCMYSSHHPCPKPRPCIYGKWRVPVAAQLRPPPPRGDPSRQDIHSCLNFSCDIFLPEKAGMLIHLILIHASIRILTCPLVSIARSNLRPAPWSEPEACHGLAGRQSGTERGNLTDGLLSPGLNIVSNTTAGREVHFRKVR
jgi:hypothetical protein